MWVSARAVSSKGTISLVSGMVPNKFGDESVNFSQTCVPCGPIAQWSDYSYGLQRAMGASSGRVKGFSSPVTIHSNIR